MKDRRKETRFPAYIFFVYLVVLLVMAGIHSGLLVLMNRFGWSNAVQVALPVLYWSLIAGGMTVFTRWRIQKTYDAPMRRFAQATRQVANGDFSVYMSPIHTAENADYLDVMIEDFNKMVAELGSMETLKTDFFANVSHEIKTPLAIIQNNAALLQDAEIAETQRQEYTQTIMQTTRKLSGLISNILKLNKLEKQSILPTPEPYDLCAQLCECVLQFDELMEEKDIQLEVDIEEKSVIAADANLLELVWNNLLSNALKFTPKGGCIEIQQYTDAGRVVVSVSDTGCGMDSKTQERIFDKFYQGDTSHSTEGNGLGLALVLRVLNLLDGSITVKSEPGQGSVFTVDLPVAVHQEGDSE